MLKILSKWSRLMVAYFKYSKFFACNDYSSFLSDAPRKKASHYRHLVKHASLILRKLHATHNLVIFAAVNDAPVKRIFYVNEHTAFFHFGLQETYTQHYSFI